jgi:hypothetical protein
LSNANPWKGPAHLSEVTAEMMQLEKTTAKQQNHYCKLRLSTHGLAAPKAVLQSTPCNPDQPISNLQQAQVNPQ